MKHSLARVPWPVLSVFAALFALALAAQKPEANPAPALPVGLIVAFGGPASAVPGADSWLLCDGREVRTDDYPQLAAALGRAWGGEGGKFRLPDLRGRFLRGVNYDAPNGDPDSTARVASAVGGNAGNEVGSVQDDAVGPHTHGLLGAARGTGGGLEGTAQTLRFFGMPGPDPDAPLMVNPSSIVLNTGIETRPRNAAVNWIIKAR